ncbi:hypothetical protein NQ317_018523 [Molorchus minor]|uniref:TGS domain-containing protein n=1 Tax=Molorchus minor TaxID=1323400 RepID=A0ABQ9IXF4_9CUCU|nr:hypothetical protein NQ317_018523 [Molorchus minor]
MLFVPTEFICLAFMFTIRLIKFPLEEVDKIARQPNSIVVSCNMELNLDYLLITLWEYLCLIRVYTKKPGQPPDFADGLILRKGVTVEHVCHAIHRTLASQFKYALVWGTSTNLLNVLELIILCTTRM